MISDPKAAKAVVVHSTKVLSEFKAFISKGNVVDLAVGVIIGAAFGKIVTALVNDIIMPPIGMIMRGIQFNDLFLPLNGKHYATIAAAKADSAAILAYGNFINTVIEFLIISACVFALVKVITTLRLSQPTPPAAPTKSEELLTEIRDLLQQKNSN
jgi:large conductance mechanosensitive channel